MISVALRHRFDGFDLDVDFQAPPGVTVFFGRSGSGKSTIVNAVAGLLRPDRGRIAVDGRVLIDTGRRLFVPPHRRRIGYVFQEGRLFPHLTVRQNLLYGRWFAGPAAADPRRIVDMLGIAHLAERRPATLSGGEKQRVAIGRALLAGPSLILADEPLAALDEARKAEILPYFERLRDEVAVPILYVTHSATEAARLATTVVALEHGRITRQGPAALVLGDPFVTPLGVREAGAVIEAVVAVHHADGLTELAAAGEHLFVPCLAEQVGARVRLRVAAHDVTLALHRPEAISALNILPGTVAEMRAGDGPGVLVALDTAPGRLLARITRRSADALALAPGTPVHAIVKTVSIAPADVGSAW